MEQPLIIVGGAPRSGTTVTQALLCSSSHTHRYCPEASFLLPLFNAYRFGVQNWSFHTAAFYPSQTEFADRMRENVRSCLADISRALGNPEVLCMKDPLLTAIFYWVHHLLAPQVKFVTVVRNPFDIVRSRQEVVEKSGRQFTHDDARIFSQEINESYAHLGVPQMRDAVFSFRYEDLSKPELIQTLGNFTGLPDISTEKVWTEKVEINASDKQNPWFSPKYHGPISLENRLSPLSPQLRRVVYEVCAPLMQQFGYQN